MTAIYLAEYSTSRIRGIAKPLLEILAGIPTVVYGFFAALTVAPWVRGVGESVGFEVASESALAAGLVMGIMIIPLISSLADDAINANLTANPFEAVTTVTVQIVTLLVGDQEFDSAKTLAAFALGLMLFVVTLFLNIFGLYVVRKYREQYD